MVMGMDEGMMRESNEVTATEKRGRSVLVKRRTQRGWECACDGVDISKKKNSSRQRNSALEALI